MDYAKYIITLPVTRNEFKLYSIRDDAIAMDKFTEFNRVVIDRFIDARFVSFRKYIYG